MPTNRPGWPLDFIPAGRENWKAFAALATPEQMERALLAGAYHALLIGKVQTVLMVLEAVIIERERRASQHAAH